MKHLTAQIAPLVDLSHYVDLPHVGWVLPNPVIAAPAEPQKQADLPLVGWVREATVLKFVPISKSTMWVWIKKGKFPSPTRLSNRVTAWSVLSLRQYIQDPANWTPSLDAGTRPASDEVSREGKSKVLVPPVK